ncbi:MAG: histidine kinase [Oscillospiraceae bacterium]|nr:histidine kinase [Oscillospiraceae bacterium]
MMGQKSVWSYIRGYRFNSLLAKNFAYVFVLVTIPLLLVLILNYNKFNDQVNRRVIDMNEELLQNSALVTDNIMSDLLDNANVLSQMDLVVEAVQTEHTQPQSYDALVNELVDQVNAYVGQNDLIAATYIYSDANGMLISKRGAYPVLQSRDKGKWYYIHQQQPMVVPYVLINNTNSIYICQPIWSLRGQPIGLVVLDARIQNIRSMLESQNTSQQGTFFIMDSSGDIIYCNEQNNHSWNEKTARSYEADIAGVKVGQSGLVEKHSKRIISVTRSTVKSWKYAFVTELPDYKDEMSTVRGFLLTSVSVGVLTSIIVAFVITVFTYRPVRKIINVIQNPQLHWNEKAATKQSNELLLITGNILAADSDANLDISESLGDRIRSLRQAQFRALQFQIDPHFLYNTLETIKWSAVEEMGLGNKTSKMLTKVARLYRLGLENDDVLVSMKEELDFLKLYIEILRIRFGDSIQFHWDIDESLYDFNVIKMCLQPIVENAIQHGLRPNNYHGNITVSAYLQKETLCICVENDGHGMSQSEIKILNEKLKTGAGFEESKVGLRNVNERIKLIYGKKYGVSISQVEEEDKYTPQSDKRVRVVLRFPSRNFYRSEETK